MVDLPLDLVSESLQSMRPYALAGRHCLLRQEGGPSSKTHIATAAVQRRTHSNGSAVAHFNTVPCHPFRAETLLKV